MTDKEKLEKIVAYLMRRMYAHNQKADIGSTGEIFDEKIENAKYEECRDTLNFIDSMQEECNITSIKSKEATGKLKECIDNITDESLAKARKQLQEESQVCMYSTANYTDEDRKALCDGCEEECKYASNIPPVFDEGYWERLGEKSVSEGLEQAIDTYLATYFGGEKEKQEWPFLKKMAIHFAEWQKQKDSIPVSEDLEEVIRKYEQRLEKENPATEAYDFAGAIRFGANWQKQQMEAYRIEHCKSLTNEQAELEDNFVSSHVEKNNRMPTFIDAIEYGIEYGKQQMLKNAVSGHIGQTVNGLLRALSDEVDDDLGFEAGNKVKLIIIKEM